MKTQEFKCTYCNQPFTYGDRLEIDHIIPKSRGGKDTYSNLQLLHKICHVGKTRDDKKPLISVPDLD